MTITIRKEKSGDQQAIREVTIAAFEYAAHSQKTEHTIVAALREAEALSISLLAEEKGRIIGHVAVSPVSISDGTKHWYGLGPISVLPENQNSGIGSMLMNAAIKELKHMEAAGCVLLGDPNYYQRFGFQAKEGLTLEGVPPEYFQALTLKGNLPQGRVTYHPAFSTTA